jgi:ADP-heptose:LPS heptosyltransferase
VSDTKGLPTPRFLVLRGGGIRDFIVTLPVLQVLRTQWPAANIEIWGYPHIAELAVEAGLAQTVVSLEQADMSRFFVPEPSFTDHQVAVIRSFDLLFNYLYDPIGQVRSNLLLAGAKQVLSGSPLIKKGHAIPFLLEPLQALALYEDDLVPTLDLPEDLKAAGKARLRALGIKGKPLAVHPGSGQDAAGWPVERTIELIRSLRKQGREVVMVSGEADESAAELLAREVPDVPVLSRLTLVELAATLSVCDSYLGQDSGITHLAAAVGLPVLALFGPSNPATWAPRGWGQVTVVQAPEGEMVRLPVSTVWDALS